MGGLAGWRPGSGWSKRRAGPGTATRIVDRDSAMSRHIQRRSNGCLFEKGVAARRKQAQAQTWPDGSTYRASRTPLPRAIQVSRAGNFKLKGRRPARGVSSC